MTRLSIGGKSRKGVNRSQARSQVVTVWGYLTPMSDSEKSVRACQAASWFGAVQIGLENGRDLPALPCRRRTASRGAEPGGPHRWGPWPGARTACVRLGKAGEPVTFPRALRSRAGGAPSTIRHASTLRLCQLSAHEPPFKEAPSPGPGPRYLSHVLDTVHAPPRPRCGPSGRRPGEQARTIGPDRARGRPLGRGLLQRTRAATRATASATASAGPRNGPRAERGGQVVLDIPDVSIPPAHQAW